jgi:Ca2+/Na+ antiporter
MCNPVTGVLFAVAMIAVVVGVDLLFFRVERWFWFWQRLAANIGTVLSAAGRSGRPQLRSAHSAIAANGGRASGRDQ